MMSVDERLLNALRPEARLLLLSAGPGEMDGRIRQIMRDGVDWMRLAALADRERASGPLWHRLRAVAPDVVPDDVRTQLERMAQVAEFTSAYIQQRLNETLRALGARNIDVLLLKGAALAQTTYRSFSERPMGDLDLLVDRTRAAEAHAAAQSDGWLWDQRQFPASRYEGHHHLPPLLDGKGTGVRLELHTGLFIDGHPFELSRARLMEGATRIEREGVVFHVSSPEHQLLHLCVHFAWSHMMAVGVWRAIRDVRAIVGAGRIDWDRFVKLAHENKASTCCYWTFRLSSALSGVTLPERVMRAFEAPESGRMGEWVERHMAQHVVPADAICPSEQLRRWMWDRAVRPSESGHGEMRPWQLDESELVPDDSAVSLVRRTGQQFRRLGMWGSYIRQIIAPRQSYARRT